MIVRFSTSALSDIEAISVYLSERYRGAAKKLVERIVAACEDLADMPLRYSFLPRHEQQGFRRRRYGSYLIFFRIGDETIDVVRILHGAMDYDKILFPDG